MNKVVALTAWVGVLLLISLSPVRAQALSKEQLRSIIESPSRHEADRQRDSDRKPLKVLKFSEVARGQTVLDIYAGGGWFSELFSHAVGEQGRVYAHNDDLTFRFGGKEMDERTENSRLSNVVRIDKVDLGDVELAPGSVDIAFMGINYHDLFFTSRVRNGKSEIMREKVVDHQPALAVIRRALKDEGVLIITDHIAMPGSGYAAANDLHRIDPAIVRYQLNQAGFTLVEEAFYLRNPEDDLQTLVFDPKIRGKTSRFMYKFIK